jgi:hypothetical protein
VSFALENQTGRGCADTSSIPPQFGMLILSFQVLLSSTPLSARPVWFSVWCRVIRICVCLLIVDDEEELLWITETKREYCVVSYLLVEKIKRAKKPFSLIFTYCRLSRMARDPPRSGKNRNLNDVSRGHLCVDMVLVRVLYYYACVPLVLMMGLDRVRDRRSSESTDIMRRHVTQ